MERIGEQTVNQTRLQVVEAQDAPTWASLGSVAARLVARAAEAQDEPRPVVWAAE